MFKIETFLPGLKPFFGVLLFFVLLLILQKLFQLVTIEAVFLLANIFSVFVNFYKFGDFSSYTLILTGLLFAGIIFEIIQVFVSQRIPASPI